MTQRSVTLVGDGIENPWNARAMVHAAAMFGSRCLFRDRYKLAHAWAETLPTDQHLDLISHEELARNYSPMIVFDNLESATSVYDFRLAWGSSPAVVVGNERRGIGKDIPPIADHAVQIPMASRQLNCLNVAAASAVALYYLSGCGGGGKLQVRTQPNRRRPELLFMGASDHVELGSSIRSAGAFGWGRLLIEDHQGVWFGRDRAVISEGRAAARRARNPIRIIPTERDQQYVFAEACVCTLKVGDLRPHQSDLAGGASQLIIIPDETKVKVEREDGGRFAKKIRFLRLNVPASEFAYHYRLVATIVLAEVARQVGRPARGRTGAPRGREPVYDSQIKLLSEERGETIFLDELEDY